MAMSDREIDILTTIITALPKMSERQKGRIIGYGEAIIDIKEEREEEEKKKKVS